LRRIGLLVELTAGGAVPRVEDYETERALRAERGEAWPAHSVFIDHFGRWSRATSAAAALLFRDIDRQAIPSPSASKPCESLAGPPAEMKKTAPPPGSESPSSRARFGFGSVIGIEQQPRAKPAMAFENLNLRASRKWPALGRVRAWQMRSAQTRQARGQQALASPSTYRV
jgi:hypothetical protein